MELDVIDPVAVSVVGPKDRRVAIGLHAEPERPPSNRPAEVGEAFQSPRPALALDRLSEDDVLIEQVVVLERGRLVQDVVRGVPAIDQRHEVSLAPQNTWGHHGFGSHANMRSARPIAPGVVSATRPARARAKNEPPPRNVAPRSAA